MSTPKTEIGTAAALAVEPGSPLVAPPFDGRVKQPLQRYAWWSWHPLYPYWSKSCWGGSTEAEAMADFTRPEACGLDVYHNKLIREDDGGKLVEVADRPCHRLDVWERCRALPNAASEPRASVPCSTNDSARVRL